MLFLGPFYNWINSTSLSRVNHFPLVRLVVYSLDKTILYLLIFAALRCVWLLTTHRRTSFGHELKLGLFMGYLILLFMLTVFRDVYYPWQLTFHWDRPLSVINLHPLVETLKLRQAASHFDLWYQSLGNVAWFMPLGFGIPWISTHRRRLGSAIAIGLVTSLSIETLQFMLISGVADIDDVIFNLIGAILGYGFYRILHPHR
ncbi:VanZ family protein [Lacticaseibacillus chiayiensis]|uniref:VanZ family protein n=1 Tax=Lacticaseibacillus chiayiensis TaxID=2100821 RepID=A0A4Q1TQF8_9LACO|nr:VanZ family protein [Lacticaseibacillus chiayiensis]QVI36020.1 VanZ family protein [Lacticaseibacillus chiayiensis]RXT20673.1 VanZ family protein [Lacticaseibacillus chiayiensis]RXT56350.1 VanZ family protein [Lacticaseibacillus chiayiensis]UYN57821.1 VanZ family protein [Lacticaseibacillus chiayiensis]